MTDLLSTFTQADAIFIGSGFLGMIAHYVKQFMKDQTTSTVFGHFGTDDLKATILTLGAFAMAVITALNSGIITPDMGIWAVIYSGMTTGYAVDSGFNNSTKPDPKPTE